MPGNPLCPECGEPITHRRSADREPPACADCLFEDAIERSRHDPERVNEFLNQLSATSP